MFTKKQIDEIAAKLADLAIKDSQFRDMNKPLNGSENIPLLQDGENRLMSLPDLVNLIIGDEDKQYIKCILNVECLTSGATILIKGQGEDDYAVRTSYTAYYGEIVDVQISADGHDTWYGAVTMTQNHTIVVSLNEEGGSSPSPGPSPTTTYYICLKNTQGATIEINGTRVASGSMNYFKAGDTVSWVVSLDGYDPDIREITSISRNYDETITLDESSSDTDPYLYFGNESVEINKGGGQVNVSLQSNVTWQISAADVPVAPDEGGEEPEPGDDELTVELPDNVTVFVGESVDII